MHVGVDVSGLFWKYRTGVQILYYGLVEGLRELDLEGGEISFIDRSGQPDHSLPFEGKKGLSLRTHVPLPFMPSFRQVPQEGPLHYPLRYWNSAVRELRSRIARHDSRLTSGLDVFQVWNWDLQEVPGAAHVITVPDVIPLLFPDLYPVQFIEATKESLKFAAERAAQVIAISEYTKKDLIEKAAVPEEKISVVYPGLRTIFRPIDDTGLLRQVRHRYGIGDSPFLISVGFIDPRKNVKGHVTAFERLVAQGGHDDLKLVLVGPESISTNRLLEEIRSAGIRSQILVTGFVPDEDLVVLLNAAEVFLYCSLYEGFGFPVIEAMACGIPVVTSNGTSLAEVAGDAALLVDPHDPDTIAAAVRRYREDSTLRKENIARGLKRAASYSWAQWAQGHLDAYAAAAGASNRAR